MKRLETSTSADLDFKNIEDYLLKEWSYDVLVDFYDKYDKALEILSSEKVVFSRYEETEFSKYLLTKHNTIIYKIENDIIYIVRILQNFQDPNDNEKSLKS